jgi:glutamate/tyrosine decarboxylase-like PLP-dependent enzyme
MSKSNLPAKKSATNRDMQETVTPEPAAACEIQSPLLWGAARHADRYLNAIRERHVGALLSGDDLRRRLGRPLPEDGEESRQVIDELAGAGQEGTTASQGPRYFGFVTGGSLPVATAADWLVSAWDQNAQVYVMSPIACVVEEITVYWLKDLLGLPATWSVGFVTGAQMANFTSLLAARHHMLRGAGWDVERDGLFGAPPIDVIVSDESHRTIFTALRMLGLGGERVRRVETDDHGRMRTDRLAEALRSAAGPCIVCAQVGNVNTGAADPLANIAPLARERGAWLHVDGAFGLWAAVSPLLRHLVEDIQLADSIATDGHKWLNVPYDSGIVLTAHPDSHQRALMLPVHYIQMTPGERDPRAFTPDESRRARAVPIYAALRSLGRNGVRKMIERCCACARRMADRLRQSPHVRILNEVVLNQVLVQFVPLAGDPRGEEEFTDNVVAGIQNEGSCWLGGTQWHGRRAARISICNWATTEHDIDRSAAAILGVIDSLNVHTEK